MAPQDACLRRHFMGKEIINQSEIAEKIHIIRGKRVMIDRDLAELYDVETKYLNRQVKRNMELQCYQGF